MDAAKEQRVVHRPFGPFERMLAMRYLGAKREHGGLAFISVVSVIGITLGVWALILTMSIMNGFRLELVSKIVGFEPHVFIDTRGVPQPQVDALMEELLQRPGVESVEPLHEGTGLASAYNRSEGIQVRGVRPEDIRNNKMIAASVAGAAKPMPTEPPKNRCSAIFAAPSGSGSLSRFGDEGALSADIVMGDSFAYALGVGVGDKVTITQPNGARTAFGTSPRTRTYTISAIYHVGNERFDRYVVFLPIESSKNLFGYDEGYPLIGIRLNDPNAAEGFVKTLEQEKPYRMQSWIQRNSTFVTALVVERNVMRLILFIVVVITALNIITGVLMLVKNKARDIAILRTIGATRGGVVRIFMMTGTVLGMAGVGTGVLLGVLSATFIADIQHFLENLLGFCLFPPDIYQLDALPAQLEWGEVGWVGGLAFLVTLVMSIIPSLWAARLNPVEALRFE
ncbi:MAG: FtsX-like permease family protein [Alphaproteobacteria bacterium]|nr:MAG: FtsX-like permease family protein [Alphaproteobacteria bacterium]